MINFVTMNQLTILNTSDLLSIYQLEIGPYALNGSKSVFLYLELKLMWLIMISLLPINFKHYGPSFQTKICHKMTENIELGLEIKLVFWQSCTR